VSMPFNIIYQVAQDREMEIREQVACDCNHEVEEPKKEGWFTSLWRAIFHKTEAEMYYRTTAPNGRRQMSEYR
jgi:hypothetical protein